MRIVILPTCGKHLHESIILLRGEVWTHKTSLSSPFFIGVPVPRKGSEWSYLYWNLEIFRQCGIFGGKCSNSVVFFGEMFRQCGIFWGKCSDSVVFLDGNVPTVWYFWEEMFRHCGIICTEQDKIYC